MLIRMEHANIRVDSVDQKADFLKTAFPEFGVRAERVREEGGSRKRWIHLGTDSVYVTLGEVKPAVGTKDQALKVSPDGERTGVGHIGYVVDDVATVAERLANAGYYVGQIWEEGPGPSRKRFYATDSEDVEWEFVEYLTDDPALMNIYE